MGWPVPALILLGMIAVGSFVSSTTLQQSATAPALFSHIVTILMENHGLNDTYGAHCLGNCTYITQLANQFGLAERYSGIAHPSLPNYLTLTSGGNYDRPPFDRDCYPENLTTGC